MTGKILRNPPRRTVELLDAQVDGALWALDTETDGLDVRSGRHTAHLVGLMPVGFDVALIWDRAHWRPDLVSGLRLVGHNMRFDVHAAGLAGHIREPWGDTMVWASFNNTAARSGLDALARRYGYPGKVGTPAYLKAPADGTNQIEAALADPERRAELEEYLADDLRCTAHLVNRLLRHPYCDVDERLEAAVQRMEARGVRVVPAALDEFEAALRQREQEARTTLRRDHGFGDRNPSSPKQVGEWLVGKGRRLPRSSKSGQPKTDAVTLKRFADAGDEAVLALLSMRSALRMQSGFVAGVRSRVRADGMIYPSVHTTPSDQGGTRTGRFSYSDPPLQQAPKRDPYLGPLARRCFSSRGGYVAGADFSQVELRVAAALSGEPVLLEAFAQGEDPHRQVAARAFGFSMETMTPEQRFLAKAINFGILNGMGAPRLATQIGCLPGEAARFLDDYRYGLPVLTDWMEGVWSDAEARRCAWTVAGRARPFPADDSTRPAISVIVQGTAAELIRVALLALDEADARPILQMHDEILCESPLISGEDVATIMRTAANDAFPDELGAVDFAAEGGQGETWAAIK